MMMRPAIFLPIKALARCALVGIAALTAACSTVDEPVFYLLEANRAVAGTRAQAPPAGSEIGLREVALPLYARRPQIPVLNADGSIKVSDGHRWAEEPARATTRLIARTMSSELAHLVVVEPWLPEVSPTIRVDVDVDYLIGALGDELRLEGQYRAFAAGDAKSAITRRFNILEPVAGPTYGDLSAAHTRALIALGVTISSDLRIFIASAR